MGIYGTNPFANPEAEDFASCVANFTRWGREVPVVLYHADTDATAHPDARRAHAWITEMRVGAMDRRGRTCATLEARFRWVDEATRADVDAGRLACGSVTIVQGGTDEETGEPCGSFLWSFSLTNNPALVDLPRIAAEHGAPTDPADVPPATRGPAAQEHCMSTTYMVLAARLGLTAATDEEAQRHVVARAEESQAVRRQLDLRADADATAVAAEIAKRTADAARVAVLSAENEALKADAATARDREVKEHVEALCADPTLAKARPALEAFAKADFAAFSKAYPKPAASPAARTLMTRVTGTTGETVPEELYAAAPKRHNDAALDRAHALMKANPALALDAALKQASRELRAGKGN